MEDISAYEMAQQRIVERQRQKNRTFAWLLLTMICLLLSFVGGNCVLPLLATATLFAVYSGTAWYFTSTKWTPSMSQVEQEITWLFGDRWRETADVYEFSLAMQRIHQRRRAQKEFIFHLGFFLLANLFIFGMVIRNLTYFRTPGPMVVLVVPIVWLAVVIYHLAYAFPTQRSLIQREQRAGEAIQYELERIQPTSLKHKDKLKRDTYYVLGDDGELVEVNEEALEDE